MKEFKEIDIEKIENNPFRMIGREWMLVTAKKDGKVNTMTASWGGLGVIWSKNVAYVVIRPQRYTKEFIDSSDTFSLTFLDDKYRKELSYLGTVSGKDEDKILKTGLTAVDFENTPYFEEGKLVLICRKLYAQQYDPKCFIDEKLDTEFYPDKDYHIMYIAEITKALSE
ncbi:MAG: flavin reductase [Solirubrobacterales bacterium]